MSDYKIEITEIEPENILKNITDIKTKLNLSFPKSEDNVIVLKNICIELFSRVSELERKVKALEK